MATLTIDRRTGVQYNIQWYEGKQRFTVLLGGSRYSRKTAERLKDVIERLLYYRRNPDEIPDKMTKQWLKDAPAEIQAKLAKVGLIVVEEVKTCQYLWDMFLLHKAGMKPSTKEIYKNAMTRFFEAFSQKESIDKVTVKSPKTEHHENHDDRVVPLFPELREELEKHNQSTEFVVQGFQGTSWVLYFPFQEISERAGLGQIRSPFRNMRRSRSNEIMRKHGSQIESKWIGHSEKVMEDHYFDLEDEDYLKALG